MGASFGRSFYVLDDYSMLRQATGELFAENKFHMFPIRRAFWFRMANKLGGEKGFQGDSLYNAKNPDYGAVFRYYIGDEFKSKKSVRKKKEAELRKAGKDIPTPSLEELREEGLEKAPGYFARIMDSEGTVVAKMDLAAGKGIHKSVWNMQHSGLGGGRRGGPAVAPGTYQVEAFKSVDGEETSLGDPVSFEVESIMDPTIKPMDRGEVIAFIEEASELSNKLRAASSTLSERSEQLDGMMQILKSHPNGSRELVAEATELKKRLDDFDRQLGGDDMKSEMWIRTEPGIQSRIRSAMFSAVGGTHGPTKAAREQLEIGAEQFAEIEEDLFKLLDKELEAFEKKLDKADIPWTPGRDLPE